VFQYHLGLIYRSNGQIKEAEEALRKALGGTQAFRERSLAQEALQQLAGVR
jgi:hypothetical protein